MQCKRTENDLFPPKDKLVLEHTAREINCYQLKLFQLKNCEDCISIIYTNKKYKKVKVSPLQAMKAHGGYGYKGPHIHSHGTRKR